MFFEEEQRKLYRGEFSSPIEVVSGAMSGQGFRGIFDKIIADQAISRGYEASRVGAIITCALIDAKGVDFDDFLRVNGDEYKVVNKYDDANGVLTIELGEKYAR